MRGADEVTSFYRFIGRASLPILTKVYRLRVTGLEHVPKVGGFVVAANHLSNLDPWPLAIALWPRQLHFMAKAELWWPGLRTLLRAAGAFPVRRGEVDVEAMRTAIELCRRGRILAMFPEGTRRAKGLRKRHRPTPHAGTARIALAAGVPLVPAAIAGTDRLSRLEPLAVAFGPPIEIADLRSFRSSRAARVATELLWSEITRLEAELAASRSDA